MFWGDRFVTARISMQNWPDEDIATNDTSTPTPVSTSTIPLGPITRARARRLTHQVNSLLSSGSSYLDNGDTCTLVLLRNNGLDQKERGIGQAGFGLQDVHNCDGRHDFIRTPFWSFKCLLESLSNLRSNGSGISSISFRSQPQFLIYYKVLFSHGAASPYFGPTGRVSS
jgi:hypothetical protein